ncbi:MAG: hypothetical protein JWP88_1180 [Flaviaesturariibacter sp.]|nr:hypothetical protein [Flaviaesturariibacter sp.]
MTDNHSLLHFIRGHRGDEAHFYTLYDRLVKNISPDEAPLQAMKEEGEKAAAVYINAKEKSGSAWPEFENFVSLYEKSLIKSGG